MTGAQLILKVLEDEGVDVVFGYPGGAIMPLYDALYGHSLRHILTRHEQGAAFAAGGFARSTGRVGVCFATSGPGATNLVTGLVDALMDSVPIVAITGQVRTVLMGTDGFQEADVTAITHTATKRNVCVRSVDDLERSLRAAFRIARGPRPGPVLVDVPTDILKATLKNPSPPREPQARRVPAAPSRDAIRQAADLIVAAARPVLIVGGGARTSDAVREFRELCAALRAPHTATINGLGCAHPDDPRFLGMLGMHGWKAANLAVAQADLILALGMRFDDRVTGRTDRFAQKAKIVHADIDEAEFDKIIHADVRLHGDLRTSLRALIDELDRRPLPSFDSWSREARALGAPPPRDHTEHSNLSATDVLDALVAAAPADTIITTDVGQHQMWMAQRVRPVDPRSFITSAGLGTMGFGVPSAVGAQFGNPERTVIAVCGDGGFQMTLNELATIRRYGLPVKILIIDNQRLGMVRQWQELFYERRYSAVDLTDNPDFTALAGAFGIRGESIASAPELPGALDRFLRLREPALLHCACHPMENVWPIIPPGGATTEAMESASA
jgi:acetolactate synthase-1/2/3 large subunit